MSAHPTLEKTLSQLRKNGLAPVVIFGFNRPDHFAQSLEYLKQNTLAKETDLYIFIDGPRHEEEAIEVRKVRQVAEDVTGFNRIEIQTREENQGLAPSVIQGVTKIVGKYGKVIVLEDDLLTAKGFLVYMNQALNHYQGNNRIMSISGFCHPPSAFKIPDDYDHDVFFSYRNNPWGWATWKEKWAKVDFEVKDYQAFRLQPWKQMRFQKGGIDLPDMLRGQMVGEVSSWAVRFSYAHFKQRALSVFPTVSQTFNIGFDGTGTHLSDSTLIGLENNLPEEVREFKFPQEIFLEPRILEAFRGIYAVGIKRRLWWIFKSIMYPIKFNK